MGVRMENPEALAKAIELGCDAIKASAKLEARRWANIGLFEEIAPSRLDYLAAQLAGDAWDKLKKKAAETADKEAEDERKERKEEDDA